MAASACRYLSSIVSKPGVLKVCFLDIKVTASPTGKGIERIGVIFKIENLGVPFLSDEGEG